VIVRVCQDKAARGLARGLASNALSAVRGAAENNLVHPAYRIHLLFDIA
jgi:hypothetical protein